MNLADEHGAIVLIPAYNPPQGLVSLVRRLTTRGLTVVVVDDGSRPEFRPVFESLRPMAAVLRHAINLGKGAALKTGINHVLCEYPQAAGIVTADADGQHTDSDIAKVASRLCSSPGRVVLGVRRFDSADVPWRSRFGNQLTNVAVRWLIGQRLGDTQTGLRGLPATLLPHLLTIRSSGYEFELDVLIACRQHGFRVLEEPVATIYEDGNKVSHFNPLLDSLRIYFVLLRFSFVSLLTSLLDNAVFILVYPMVGSVAKAQILGRGTAVLFNYFAARRAVFLSREAHAATFPRYLLLVVASGFASYGLIQLLVAYLGFSAIVAKVAAEATLFIANFAIQRDFVFRKQKNEQEATATDWDRYYKEVPATAKLSRRYTGNVISTLMRTYGGSNGDRPVMVELGGANSCFFDQLLNDLKPRAYHVIDTNAHGLRLLSERARGTDVELVLHQQDCRTTALPIEADIVFSVGLIEHFTPEDTRRAIRTHFDLLRPGGCALISYPTPTWLYRTMRAAVTAIGQWRFPDERPLERDEVLAALGEHGELEFEKVLWPIVFTQRVMVVRKRGEASAATC